MPPCAAWNVLLESVGVGTLGSYKVVSRYFCCNFSTTQQRLDRYQYIKQICNCSPKKAQGETVKTPKTYCRNEQKLSKKKTGGVTSHEKPHE